MSDTTQILQLHGAQLESIAQDADTITLHFSLVHLVQEMENAFEDSLWTQAIDMAVTGIEIEGGLPDCPCELSGGDLTDNIFTYRDHAPLPINWRGDVRCKLITTTGGEFSLTGDSLVVTPIEHPRYIRHVRKS
jgi:hypothetical protein